nr:type II toxin-antitoxin system PemK/MazF family toxin [Microcystis sp. LEGE 00066]
MIASLALFLYSVFQSAEVQKLWILGKREEAKVKREEKYVYLTSLGNAIITLTSNLRHAQIPGTMVIPAGKGGLNQESVALCYQIVIIDRQRLQRQLGTLSSSYLQQLEEAMRYTLDLT